MPLNALPSDAKRMLLELIKRRGSVSLDEATGATGLARTTLREHLLKLEADGLIARTPQRRGRGRPSLRFRLTERGEALFPTRDGLLLHELLAFLKQTDREDLIEAFFTSFWETRLREAENRLRDLPSVDPAERLALLAGILREQGFMPEVETATGQTIIRECNCPFPEAVKQTRLPCRLEARFFERLLQCQMERVHYIPDGHATCTYTLSPVPERPARTNG